MDLLTSQFAYDLPASHIAQYPAPERTDSRLMVLDRAARSISHHRFAEIGQFLTSGDVLVANRSRVIPARLQAVKVSGGKVELLLLRRMSADLWVALARPGRRLRPGMELHFPSSDLTARLDRRAAEGQWEVSFQGDDAEGELRRIGRLPLPPYINAADAPVERYQTVYADRDGSVAAPTAGLHFSQPLLTDLRSRGIDVEFITLHIGLGTFRPVQVERVVEHHMHAEYGEIDQPVVDRILTAQAAQRKVVAVGTTATRLLETAGRQGKLAAYAGQTDLFIIPGYRFRVVNALLTNFHLPRSTLLMLVCAFAGRDFVLSAYRSAIENAYRFYSFGDAMLIL